MNSVDVIIPCYRYGHFLRECVESVLQQSISDLRVLIIDDASPDNTSEVARDLARQDPRVNLIQHVKNAGHIATYNEGIEWVDADYMCLLSADDYLLPGAFERAVDLMDANSAVGFVFGNALTLDEADKAREARSSDKTVRWKILSGTEFIKLNGVRNRVLTPTVLVRTELQKRVGGYRAELPHSGDMEMWLRLAAHSSVGYLDTYQAVYRQHATNMSQNYSPERDLEQRKAALDWFFAACQGALPNAKDLSQKLYFSLSCDAVRCSSRLFNDGDLERSKQLSESALTISPDAHKSLAWAMLSFKRLMGRRSWQALQPVVSAVRKTAWSIKDLANGGRMAKF